MGEGHGACINVWHTAQSHLKKVAVLIPSSRQISGTARQRLTRFKAAIIWLSVNLDFFTSNFHLGKFYFSVLWFIGGITIRAHALVCFLALIVCRVMRQRLKLAKSDLSPEKALAEPRKIQRHSVRINKAEPISGISTISDSQAEVLETLKIRKPTQDAQLTLL